MKVERVSAGGVSYPRLNASDVGQVVSCAGKYGLLDQPEPTLVVVELSPRGGADAWMTEQLEQGRGLVLQMPDTSQIPLSSRPARSGIELFCEPDPDFLMAPAMLSTVSVNEALGFLSGEGSLVIAEPKSGWVELGSPLQQAIGRVGWPTLLVGGAVVAVGAAWALRR